MGVIASVSKCLACPQTAILAELLCHGANESDEGYESDEGNEVNEGDDSIEGDESEEGYEGQEVIWGSAHELLKFTNYLLPAACH